MLFVIIKKIICGIIFIAQAASFQLTKTALQLSIKINESSMCYGHPETSQDGKQTRIRKQCWKKFEEELQIN